MNRELYLLTMFQLV